ncbi:MAG: translation elongation factor Ts [Woeseiaceae bacterium]|nr:translation elongation factor Ts [Woeseiaceae bacterium]|tara:strand:- start:43642 stop:44520 length:879 start_codon:yes stop_codon:yes gene_type:complete
MSITASMVKELRDRTGAGMMECKKSLVEVNGDIDAAIELLRTSGQAKAEKKASRVAADGRVAIKSNTSEAVIIEINSETDFVAKDENFINFSDSAANLLLEKDVESIEQLSELVLSDSKTVEEARTELISKVGENISIRRFNKISDSVNLGIYSHGSRIGSIVSLSGGSENLAKDIAMHIAASNPICIDVNGVPSDLIEREKRIYNEQALSSGKPPEIIEKMVQGKMSKYLKEITLLGQSFVKDPDISIENLLKNSNAVVTDFIRYEVGEGIEKKEENFADEVMKQIKGDAS